MALPNSNNYCTLMTSQNNSGLGSVINYQH